MLLLLMIIPSTIIIIIIRHLPVEAALGEDQPLPIDGDEEVARLWTRW